LNNHAHPILAAMVRVTSISMLTSATAFYVLSPQMPPVTRQYMHMSAADGSVPQHLSFEETLRMLHRAPEAADEQQWRLRKSTTEAFATTGDFGSSSVYLVGVGPGDPELLTVKALKLMSTANLVLYDRLISPEVLRLVNPEAAMLYVGKEAGLHTRRQEEIHELLLQFASSGRTVVRLKGGDPTVFGRGGEELEYLEQQGVRVHIVPGITAASGIAACLRLPLTHRDFADSVRFITGHARSECNVPVRERYNWAQLADNKTTLVIYMGLSTLDEFACGLIDAGLSEQTPAVAVQDGTTATQRVVRAELGSLASRVEQAGLRSPTLVVLGGVVSLMSQDYAHPDVAARMIELTAEQAQSLVRCVSRRTVVAKPKAQEESGDGADGFAA